MFLRYFIFPVCAWRGLQHGEPEKGFYLTPISGKFGSLKVVTKKGSVPLIDCNVLEKATDNFNPMRKLGEGGFGCVYEGRLEDNTAIAVKKLDCGSKDVSREFEVLSIKRIRAFKLAHLLLFRFFVVDAI